jgi:hypothetical protein
VYASEYIVDVHLRTLSTNEPHPKALIPVLSPSFHDTDLIFPVIIKQVEISGNMLALLYTDISQSGKNLEIWNWVEFPHHSVRSLLLFQSGGFTKGVTHQCMVKNGQQVEEIFSILEQWCLGGLESDNGLGCGLYHGYLPGMLQSATTRRVFQLRFCVLWP